MIVRFRILFSFWDTMEVHLNLLNFAKNFECICSTVPLDIGTRGYAETKRVSKNSHMTNGDGV